MKGLLTCISRSQMSMEAHMNGWDGIQLESQRSNLCQRESPHFWPLPWIQSKILEMVFAKELHKLHPNCFRGNPCNKPPPQLNYAAEAACFVDRLHVQGRSRHQNHDAVGHPTVEGIQQRHLTGQRRSEIWRLFMATALAMHPIQGLLEMNMGCSG